MKTEIAAHVGKHAFETAGLGLAPFRFVGYSENRVAYPDGTTKAGGSCDYCSNSIACECWVQSADGKRFKVGSNCISKVGDKGLLQAFKNSPEFRAHKRKLARDKAAAVFSELSVILQTHASFLDAQPHPYGFIDRKTGRPLTRLDDARWRFDNSGNAGRARLLRSLKKLISLT